MSRYQPRMMQLIARAKQGFHLNPTEYNDSLNFIIAHLFVANPQSRIGAINRLTMLQYPELCSQGRIDCTDFKTWATYEAQYVHACPATIKYVIYLENFNILIDSWKHM